MQYYFSKATAGVQPYIYLSNSPVNTIPEPADIYFENIFTTPLEKDITVGPFAMMKNPLGVSGNFFYKLVVSQNDLWQFDNTPIRKSLREAFLQFILRLESQRLMAGRARIIQRYLVDFLPLTFDETLYYRYGFDPVNGYIDLQPGMKLRVDYQTHQTIDPSPLNALNGFVGAGNGDYYICIHPGNDGKLTTGFNPFLKRLARTAVSANTGGGGGPIDLFGRAYDYPYFRLLYPQSFPSSDSTGYAGVQQNVTLIGANTINDLNGATLAYLSRGNCDGFPVTTAFFRGRATITPEIPVFINSQLRYVPVGTTLRDLMNEFCCIPYLRGTTAHFKSQLFNRWRSYAIINSTWNFPAYELVTLDTSNAEEYNGGYQCYTDILDSFDLPVLGGDSLSFGIPQASGIRNSEA